MSVTRMAGDLSPTPHHDVRNVIVDIVNYTRGGREFKQREYERAEFLDNGWVRCVKPRKREDGNRAVDHCLPQNVSEISSVEPPADAGD